MTNQSLKAACALLLTVLAWPAAAGVKEGVDKWQAGDYKAAVVEWLPYAAKGDSDALFNLGQAYKLGRGVPLDKARAEDFYRRAADKGHAPAQSNLGILLAQRGEKAAAAELWKKASEKKDARAQYMLGVLHFNGDTVEKNWPLAYAYMVQANKAGLPQAGRALSTMSANMPQTDRDRGMLMAEAATAGDRLTNSGKPVAPPRKIANDLVVAKPQNLIETPSATARPTSPARPAPTISTAALTPTPIRLTNAPKPQARPVVNPVAIPDPAGKTQITSRWRVQLGAFSREARARDAWSSLRREQAALVGKAQPFYVAGGDVVRLQIGGFANAADAGGVCRELKATGRACFVIEAN